MRRIISAVLIALLLPGVIKASPYIVIDERELTGAVVLSVCPVQDQPPQYIVGQKECVWLWADGERTLLIQDLPGRVTALAYGDLRGDGENSLLVAMDDGAGVVGSYRRRDGIWLPEGSFRVFADPINFLEIHDLNRDGLGDLVIRSFKGQAQVLLSWGNRLYPFWKSNPDQEVNHLEVVDINGDGIPEIIYTYKTGYIGILSWDEQQFITLWENFPWGFVESLVILNEGEYPEWLVVTSQKMVYGWRWQNEEIVASRHFHDSDLGDRLFYLPGQGLFSFSQKTGLSFLELKAASAAELWNIPGLYGAGIMELEQGYLIHDIQGNYFRLMPGNREWKIFVKDREITGHLEVIEKGPQFYFNLGQLGEELGFAVSNFDSWHLLQGKHYLKIRAESGVVEVDNLPIPLDAPVLEINGVPFASSALLPFLGWSTEVDRARRKLVFLENWGWWF
ncbi:MAG: VCBS repeat-containing protein [Firmicutes bacterium]|nr:VCBS repeat-containing protein [Bacillota bacterium]